MSHRRQREHTLHHIRGRVPAEAAAGVPPAKSRLFNDEEERQAVTAGPAVVPRKYALEVIPHFDLECRTALGRPEPSRLRSRLASRAVGATRADLGGERSGERSKQAGVASGGVDLAADCGPTALAS
jgi:hypothetical protein